MGNNQQNKQEKGKFNPEHPRFKNARLTIDKKVVLQEKYNQQHFTEMTQKIFSLNSQDKKLPLLFPKMQMTHSQNLCGVDKSVNMIYHYCKFTLYEEISRRKAMKLNFQQTQLWFLLFNLTLGSSIFQRKKQKSGDIRPRNILIDQKGDIFIINSLTFPYDLTNYYKSLYHKQKTYLAPQQLAELQNEVKYCKSDPVISQSFSIGLTMLDACLLTDCQELYDFQEFNFKNYLFQQNLVAMKCLGLSPFFIKTILNLLEVQCYNRPTPGQVLAIIHPYEKDILELKTFVPDRQKSKRSLQQFQSCRQTF